MEVHEGAPGPYQGLTGRIIGTAIEVHRNLGPGLLESTYHAGLGYELARAGLGFRQQVSLPIIYKDVELREGYRLDFVIEESVIVEIKAVESLPPLHEAQLLTYLKLTGKEVGLLINFNVVTLKEGIKRMVLSQVPGHGPTRL